MSSDPSEAEKTFREALEAAIITGRRVHHGLNTLDRFVIDEAVRLFSSHVSASEEALSRLKDCGDGECDRTCLKCERELSARYKHEAERNKTAAERYARGEISTGKLGELVGTYDLHALRNAAQIRDAAMVADALGEAYASDIAAAKVKAEREAADLRAEVADLNAFVAGKAWEGDFKGLRAEVERYHRLRDAVNDSGDCLPKCDSYGHEEECPRVHTARWLEDLKGKLTALESTHAECVKTCRCLYCGRYSSSECFCRQLAALEADIEHRRVALEQANATIGRLKDAREKAEKALRNLLGKWGAADVGPHEEHCERVEKYKGACSCGGDALDAAFEAARAVLSPSSSPAACCAAAPRCGCWCTAVCCNPPSSPPVDAPQPEKVEPSPKTSGCAGKSSEISNGSRGKA